MCRLYKVVNRQCLTANKYTSISLETVFELGVCGIVVVVIGVVVAQQ